MQMCWPDYTIRVSRANAAIRSQLRSQAKRKANSQRSIRSFRSGCSSPIRLAYTEAEIAFTALLDRTQSLKMLDDAPAWRANSGFVD